MENLKNKIKKNIFHNETVLVSILIIVLTGALLIFSFKPVFALGSNNGAVQAGGGAELWNSSTNTFSPNVINDIKAKLFGTTNPVDYINSNYDAKEFSLSKSKVVTASTINTKVGNAQEGMVVTLGGKQWMVTSLTLADTPRGFTDVIMTLYLKQNDGISRYFGTSIDTSGSDAKNWGRNMYSNSTIRNHLLTADNWSLFSDGYFAENYLVKPKYIYYQQNLTRAGRDDSYDLKNDALGTPESQHWYDGWNYNWTSNNRVEANGKHNPYTADTNINGHRYNDWGEDYIWLPSMTETGALLEDGVTTGGASYLDKECVWKLSQAQRKHSGATWSWLRSGDSHLYRSAYVLGSSGAYDGSSVSDSLGVRPALHLNLSSAVLGTAQGVAPTNESGYDYQCLDTNNLRQYYSTLNYKHGESDKTAERNVLGKIAPNTKLATFVANLENPKNLLMVYDNKGTLIYNKGTEVKTDCIIGTGYKVELYDTNGSTLLDTVYISVLGDVNGDGRITASDVAYLRQIASSESIYTGLTLEKKLASMLINKGSVTSADAEIVRNIIDKKLWIELFY